MKVYVLFGQRPQRYEGETAPEALECVDEHTMDESPEWLENQRKSRSASGDFDRLAVLSFEVPYKTLENALYPERTVIKGPVNIEKKE